jgi:hypothetical protein
MDKPFELRVMPRGNDDYGLALYQRPLNSNNEQPGRPMRLVRIWGTPLKVTIERVLDGLKRNGYRATDLSPSRKAPFALEEEPGARLALLFMALKPLRKISRMEDISGGIGAMEPEEVYYWFSKCADAVAGPRLRRAFRILLSPE